MYTDYYELLNEMKKLNSTTQDILVEVQEEREAQLNRYEYLLDKVELILPIMVIIAALIAIIK